MNQSTFKKFDLTQLPSNPTQISVGSVVATLGAFGSSTIHYQKVGQLYFNIYFSNGGGLNVFFENDATTYAQVAVLLGITVQTIYSMVTYGGYTAAYTGGGVYPGTVPSNTNRNILGAILAN